MAQPNPLETELLREGPRSLAEAARSQGDPIRGAALFAQAQLACVTCHSCGGPDDASPLGPDLARPAPGTTAAEVVRSLLDPSETIREGFETVTIARIDGEVLAGLLGEEREDALVLRGATRGGGELVIPKAEIEERAISPTSIMPTGLVNLLADRQQFLDLASYLIEAAEFGPARARSLRPDPSVIDPPLPAYEADLDHAGLIAALDDDAFRRGELLYARNCASCHGTQDQPGSMPTSLRFSEGQFRNGKDPASLYRTLTVGFGMMPAQSMLVPSQKYDVIHYLREAYLRPFNPSQYVPADADYLATLPEGGSRGPVPPEGEPWLRADYGPSLTGTYEIGGAGNIARKGVAVRLDPGPGGVATGRAWSVFEHDTLRVAGAWTGPGFIDWNGIHFNGRHGVHPRAVGEVAFETAAGPGWADPVTGSFDDPRPIGRDGRPYGPLPRSWGRFRGRYDAADRTILSYMVGNAEVLESPGLSGPADRPVFLRSIEIGPRDTPMTLRLLRLPDGEAEVGRFGKGSVVVLDDPSDEDRPARVVGLLGMSLGTDWATEGGHLLLRVPAGEDRLRFTVWVARLERGADPELLAATVSEEAGPLDLTAMTTGGGPPRWQEESIVDLEPGPEDGPFAVDTLPVPSENPWRVQLRLSGLDFLPGGDAMAACTWDGDVWRVSGLDRADGQLTWRRIASGLFQPLGLKVVDGAIFVGCRDQIAILRDLDGNGETDFYECFNSDHQVTEHFHEFAMGLQTDEDGNFLYAKGARHAKTAVLPHHGTLLRVSRDGSRTEILATGFRAPNGVCVNPDGTFFVTDQEGHWVPKNRINWVRPDGRFFGNLWGYTDVTDPSDASQEEPMCWITNRFDRSPAEPLWVESRAWGGLDGALLSLSYGYGKVYVVPHETIDDGMQGGMVALPIPMFPTGVMRGRFRPADGHLYLCGMYSWAGNQQAPGGLYRIRATGKPAHLPVGFRATREGLALTFSDPLHPDTAASPRDFGLKAWDLIRSERYGSPHVDERPLEVTDARLSDDRRTLTLTIPGLRPTRGLELWYSVLGADGQQVDGLLHGTIHRLPE